MMERAALVDRMWASVEPHVFISKEQFDANLADWHIYDFEQDGKLVAIVAEKGPEIHFQPGGEGVPISRRIVRQVLQGRINKHGCAVTKTPLQELRQQRFNEALGFEVTGRDEYDVHYRITRIRGCRG